jgi:hypothetical protein
MERCKREPATGGNLSRYTKPSFTHCITAISQLNGFSLHSAENIHVAALESLLCVNINSRLTPTW